MDQPAPEGWGRMDATMSRRWADLEEDEPLWWDYVGDEIVFRPDLADSEAYSEESQEAETSLSSVPACEAPSAVACVLDSEATHEAEDERAEEQRGLEASQIFGRRRACRKESISLRLSC